MKNSLRGWLFVVAWIIYIAGVSLFGEYIISRPVSLWIQCALGFVVLVAGFYLFKSTFHLISNSKYFKSGKHDNN